ncbi:MAG TPA: hypothetical protein VFZ00_16250 [Solirubrobacter sp.]|nr:hypothetical protein [Solirubrobacter sp.]
MRLRPGELVAGLGGAILLVSLWLPWFSVDGRDHAAWEAMTVIDVLLALTAALALVVPIVAATARGPAAPIGLEVIASVVCAITILLVAYRLIDHPGSLQYGAWLALVGAALAWSGSWLAMAAESTPGAAPPDVPRRPAPSA